MISDGNLKMNTILEITEDVYTFFKEKHPDNIIALQQMEIEDLKVLQHTLGQAIRNEYGLWHSNSLTRNWRESPEDRFMIDGVDHSDDHPDSISNKIILALWKKVNSF